MTDEERTNYYKAYAEFEKQRRESLRDEATRIAAMAMSSAALALSIISIVLKLLR